MTPGQGVDQAFWYILGICIALLFGITVATVYFVMQQRHGKESDVSDFHDNYKLEIIWIVVPTLIAICMFFIGWSSYYDVDHFDQGNQLRIIRGN